MNITEALSSIKRELKKEIIESKHFLNQCKDRNLEISSVRSIIKNNDILGIR